jgi:hypothetical protein
MGRKEERERVREGWAREGEWAHGCAIKGKVAEWGE